MRCVHSSADDFTELVVWQYGPTYFQACTTDKATGKRALTVFRGRRCRINLQKFLRTRLQRMRNYTVAFSTVWQWQRPLPAR